MQKHVWMMTIAVLAMSFCVLPCQVAAQQKGGSVLRKPTLHSDRRSAIIAGNKIRTRMGNYGSVAGPLNFNKPKIEWPAFSGREYGYEFGPLVAAIFTDSQGRKQEVLEEGIQDGGSFPGDMEPVAVPAQELLNGAALYPHSYLNRASDRYPFSNDPSTWPVDWNGQWFSDPRYAAPGEILADLETVYLMSDQAEEGFGNITPEHDYYPERSDLQGLGLAMECRTYQFANALAEDIVFFTFELKNIGPKRLDKVIFGVFNDQVVGGVNDYADDVVGVDLLESHGIVYSFDSDFFSSEPPFKGVRPGWFGMRMLEWPTGDDDSTQIGLTAAHFVNYGELLNIQDSLVVRQAMNPEGRPRVINRDHPAWINAAKTRMFGDGIWWLSAGFFSLDPGETKRLECALFVGADSLDMMRNAEIAKLTYEAKYRGAKPPNPSQVFAVPGDQQVTLYWDDTAEKSIDPFTKQQDFEGYKIYKSSDGEHWGRVTPDNPSGIITDSRGSFSLWVPLAQFDLINNIQGLFPLDMGGLPPGDPNYSGLHYFLGNNSGLQRSFVDTEVQNGVHYYYLVTAYDRGDPDKGLPPIENGVALENLDKITIPNAVHVVPGAPSTGLKFGKTLLSPVTGTTSTARVSATVIDSYALTGNRYDLAFEYDAAHQKYLIVRNLNLAANNLVVQSYSLRGTAVNFDGVALRVDDPPQVAPIDSLVRWKTGPKNLKITVDLGGRFGTIPRTRFRNDFEIRFADAAVDTSLSNRRPIHFSAYDKVANRRLPIFYPSAMSRPTVQNPKTDFIYIAFSRDGVKVDSISWRISFTPQDTLGALPKSGDTLSVGIARPLLPEVDRYLIETERTQIVGVSGEQMAQIKVVPNPYVVSAAWERKNPNFPGIRGERKLLFTHLPPKCTIRIYTVNGELVRTLEHDHLSQLNNGTEAWDLISKDNVEVAYGVYIFHVESTSGEKIGKFVIIK